jgi:hypothetical protein
MNTTQPSRDEWRRLYQAAAAFKEAAPWEWMIEDEIFGVQNPESKEVGYCSIMGMAGELRQNAPPLWQPAGRGGRVSRASLPPVGTGDIEAGHPAEAEASAAGAGAGASGNGAVDGVSA